MTDGKISLTKASPGISLAKSAGASGQMRVNLNWDQTPSGGGMFKKNKAVDLDLGCMYEMADGHKGVVQALGNTFGSLNQPPFVMLDGDDRSGANTEGENLIVNLDHLSEIKRILVFAYVYEGAVSWEKANGVVTVFPQGAAPIEVRLDEHSGLTMCGIAMLTNDGGNLGIQRHIRYVGGHRDLDAAFGWGMQWSAGRK